MKLVMWNSKLKRYSIFSVEETDKKFLFKPIKTIEEISFIANDTKARVKEDNDTNTYPYLPLHKFMEIKKPVKFI